MEKRAFLAIALSLLVLILYQEWLTRQYSPVPPAAPPQTEKTQPPQPQAPPPPPPPAVVSQAKSPQTAALQPIKDVRVETDNYVAVLTSQGARLKSFRFKHYRTTLDPQSPPFEIVASTPGVPYPLGVRFNHAASAADDANVVYRVEGGDLQLSGEAQGSLTFHGTAQDGTLITKRMTFTGSRYPIDLQVSAKAADGSVPAPVIMLTAPSEQPYNPNAPFEGVIGLVDNKIRREAPNDELKQGKEFSGQLSWAGIGYTYFFMALAPEKGDSYRLTVQQSGPALILAAAQAHAKAEPEERHTLFIGPKELNVLESVGRGMERAIDFGYFAFIAIPFLYILHFFHQFTGSYGIDIILLTVLLKIVTAPLTHKSYVSMKQMAKLQPQMERLKEKHKNDREKLNKEIMDMYRRNGVNPLGGCLPMVVQFPVFIGLYNALYIPIELRHASFLWIKDLSRPDWESLPFAVAGWQLGIPVLTILMGASMFIQQWMTPTTGDPNQRKLMLMMPLIFTFLFVTFPAGLTIYWLVNNVLSIAQQYWINHKVK